MKRWWMALVMWGMMTLGAMADGNVTPLDRAMRTMNDVSSLIGEQEHNIVQLEAQLDGIARQQRAITDTITRHKWQLAQLRSQYAQVVRNLHAHSTVLDRLVYIFSAKSVGQAWQRATYLRQLSAWREERSRMLAQSVERLAQQQASLKHLKHKRRASLQACNNTRAALQSRLDEAVKQVAQLRAEAPQLGAMLREKQAVAKRLSASLDNINTAQNSHTDEQVVTNLQQGSLAMPVTGRHRITGKWGRQHHPTLEYVTTVNSGIDITCQEQHARAVAVEKGVVSGVYDQGGGSCIVMVRHGDYLSVYAGVTRIVVKKGQQVERRQLLGDVMVDPTSHRPVLHFELRYGSKALDPEIYIKG